MTPPTFLDLCCGGGAATVGYLRAGYTRPTMVDLRPQPRAVKIAAAHGGRFVQADVRDVIAGRTDIDPSAFALVHVSPPCQSFTRLGHLRDAQGRAKGERADDTLLLEVLAWCATLPVPWVVENVPGAPMPAPMMLCGSAFGLGVQRHRLFSSSLGLLSPGCVHGAWPDGRPWGVYGRANDNIPSGGRTVRNVAHAREVMGIDWPMTWRELTEAIPPAYTEHIGALALDQMAAAA